MNNALLIILWLFALIGGTWALYDMLPTGFKRVIIDYFLHEEESS